MKVIRKTPTRLQLREHLLGVWLLGGCLALLGLLVFISSEPPVDFAGVVCIAIADLIILWSPVETCSLDKAQNRFTLRQRYWFSQRYTSVAIDAIQEVCVEKSAIGGISFYRVRFSLTSGQPLYLTQFPSTDQTIQQTLASQIRRFLQP